MPNSITPRQLQCCASIAVQSDWQSRLKVSPLPVQSGARRGDRMLEFGAVRAATISRRIDHSKTLAAEIGIKPFDTNGPVARDHIFETATGNPAVARFVSRKISAASESSAPRIREACKSNAARPVNQCLTKGQAKTATDCRHPVQIRSRRNCKGDRLWKERRARFIRDPAEVTFDAKNKIADLRVVAQLSAASETSLIWRPERIIGAPICSIQNRRNTPRHTEVTELGVIPGRAEVDAYVGPGPRHDG